MLEVKNLDIEEACIFSDIHWGKNKDNVQKLQQNSDLIDWIISIYKGDNLFFLGDWFDSRNSVNVHTFNVACENLEKLAANYKNIYMVVGNHDSYFKHSIDVNSVKVFSKIPNVHAIQKNTLLRLKNGRTILLVPWDGLVADKFPEEKPDYIMGHLELGGLKLNGKATDGEYTVTSVIEQATEAVFVGHYHTRAEKTYTNGKLYMVGCPRQLDWGDYANDKGIYILKTNTGETQYIKNDVSPEYVKIFWSELKAGKKIDKNLIEGNYVRFIIDEKYDYEKVVGVMEKTRQLGPLKVDYDILKSIKNLNNINQNLDLSKEDLNVQSLLFYIHKYIDKYDLSTIDREIDKNHLKSMIENYYNNPTTSDSNERN
ncbi:MAG TPA: metallophosphoesterase [Saccharofermentans sp.]|nr:metallophosphoesterase [Saccharofermentans sp.]